MTIRIQLGVDLLSEVVHGHRERVGKTVNDNGIVPRLVSYLRRIGRYRHLPTIKFRFLDELGGGGRLRFRASSGS